jgi:universal stress protein A
MSFDSIMVAVDFSAGSIAAIEKALAMAHANSRVTLVHVVSGIPLANASRYSYHLNEPEYQRLLARDAWRRLQDTIVASARASRRVHARVVTGEPSTELARIATEVDADVILVGVTRRGAIGRRVFGSTAARVIRTAGRPVLAIPELMDQRVVPGSEADQVALAA